MRLLDLFSGAGGAAVGYHQAGFTEIVGVDCAPQPRYPFPFVEADALEYVTAHGQEFDVIHASPPCQAYSVLRHLARKGSPALIEATRAALQATGKPYVIENVIGAPLHFPLMLCGSMFDLQTPCGAQLRRHRLFECSHLILAPGNCRHGEQRIGVHGGKARDRRTIMVVGDTPRDPAAERRKYHTITVTGNTPQQNVVRNRIRETFSIEAARIAMGIDWMPMADLSQAIPPAYTRWIGTQLMRQLTREETLL